LARARVVLDAAEPGRGVRLPGGPAVPPIETPRSCQRRCVRVRSSVMAISRFRPEEHASRHPQIAAAVAELGAFAAALTVQDLPERVRDSLALTVLDTLGVGVAGGLTAELDRMRSAWTLPPGPAHVWGAPTGTDVATATLINGTAVC